MRWAVGLLVIAAVAFANAVDGLPFSINTVFAAFSLLNVPLDMQYRYELFHTAYVTDKGITIVDTPLIPGSNVTEAVRLAASLREALSKHGDVVVNASGLYVLVNGTVTFAMTNNTQCDGCVSVRFSNWTSTRLDTNTWLNYTNAYVDGSSYLLLYYVKYINESHRLYVISLAAPGAGGYDYVFTWANYWFKNKTVYFGDWVVVNASITLSQYYLLLADAVDRLRLRWQASDKQYKPQAYPQIAQALRDVGRAVAATSIDLPVKEGYALVTDLSPLVVGLVMGALAGITTAIKTYYTTGNVGRAVACGLNAGIHGFLMGAVGGVSAVSLAFRAYLYVRGWGIGWLMKC
ncbi:MAG: hypothetical protein ABWK05_01550 [Pyrobaculum sp.]